MARTRAIAGAGAWMIAAALQVIPQTWPNLVHPHPWAAGIFVLAGAVMFGYAAFERKSPDGPSNFVGRDNSGDQFIAKDGSTIQKGDHHHHHYPPLLSQI